MKKSFILSLSPQIFVGRVFLCALKAPFLLHFYAYHKLDFTNYIDFGRFLCKL